MRKLALALLLLALSGCVAPMPAHDENNNLLNKEAQSKASSPWTPRMLFE